MQWKFRAGGTSTEGYYSWWLYGGNGELTAWAGESFSSSSAANRAASSFKANAATARFEVYEDSGAKWRWRARRSSDKVAASGEAFASKANAERAATDVQSNAPYAEGP